MSAARSSSSKARRNTSVCEGVVIAAKFDLLWVVMHRHQIFGFHGIQSKIW
jgi:hypothetical protein